MILLSAISRKPMSFLVSAIFVFLARFVPATAAIIHVPGDENNIQAAIDRAAHGDTVLIAPGHYREALLIHSKRLTIGSWLVTTGDTSYVSRTVIDAGGGRNLGIHLIGEYASGTTIRGLTITNGQDGIKCAVQANIVDNHIIGCGDGIDYGNGSGGLCRGNLIENCTAEALDLDGQIDIVIEKNILRNNGYDGIEIRLQANSGTRLLYVIRENEIYGNRQDGIQLVLEAGSSNRLFRIERNVIHDNGFSGVGLMTATNLWSEFKPAPIPDPVFVVHNTFKDNGYAITGGWHVVAVNNLILESHKTALNEIQGRSIVAYTLLHGNRNDFKNSNYDAPTIFSGKPALDAAYAYTAPGPGVDAGTALYVWEGDTVINAMPGDYAGDAPDLGAMEYQVATSIAVAPAPPTSVDLMNFPNPSASETRIVYWLQKNAPVHLRIFDVLGRPVRDLLYGPAFPGVNSLIWDGRDDHGFPVPNGLYICDLQAGDVHAIHSITILH